VGTIHSLGQLLQGWPVTLGSVSVSRCHSNVVKESSMHHGVYGEIKRVSHLGQGLARIPCLSAGSPPGCRGFRSSPLASAFSVDLELLKVQLKVFYHRGSQQHKDQTRHENMAPQYPRTRGTARAIIHGVVVPLPTESSEVE
jgi:hypothetical protein